jgi:hypothetical protein
MSPNGKLAWLAVDPDTLEPVICVRAGAGGAQLATAIDAELTLHWSRLREAQHVRVVYEVEGEATDIRGCGS